MTPNQLKNILAFCVLISGESPQVLHYHPEYLLEKYFRYVGALPPDDDRWNWGHHPTLRSLLDAYFVKWNIDDPEMVALLCREPV